MREIFPGRERNLVRRPNNDATLLVDRDDRRVGFEITLMGALGGKNLLKGKIRLGETFFRIAGAPLDMRMDVWDFAGLLWQIDVRGHSFMQHGSAFLHRIERVENRRPLLI